MYSPKMMKKKYFLKAIATDLRILDEIHTLYSEEYSKKLKSNPKDISYVEHFLKIDTDKIAKNLKLPRSYVFGRLMFVLHVKHALKDKDDRTINLLWINETDIEVNFPMLESVLADMRDKAWRDKRSAAIQWSGWIFGLIATVIAIAGFFSNANKEATSQVAITQIPSIEIQSSRKESDCLVTGFKTGPYLNLSCR